MLNFARTSEGWTNSEGLKETDTETETETEMYVHTEDADEYESRMCICLRRYGTMLLGEGGQNCCGTTTT